MSHAHQDVHIISERFLSPSPANHGGRILVPAGLASAVAHCGPFFSGHRLGELILDGLLTFVLLSDMATVSKSRFILVIGVALALPVIGARWLAYFTPHDVLDWIAIACAVVFFAFNAIIILVHIIRQREVTGYMIAGPQCV
jgi:hypothetical protein